MKYKAVLIVRKSDLSSFQKEVSEIFKEKNLKIEIMEDEIFDKYYRSR